MDFGNFRINLTLFPSFTCFISMNRYICQLKGHFDLPYSSCWFTHIVLMQQRVYNAELWLQSHIILGKYCCMMWLCILSLLRSNWSNSLNNIIHFKSIKLQKINQKFSSSQLNLFLFSSRSVTLWINLVLFIFSPIIILILNEPNNH